MSARLIDIAAKAGISHAAVSYVLNGRPCKVGAAMREKILKTADRLGYRPNNSARAVRMGRHGAVALIMSHNTHHSLLAPELMSGVARELARNRLRMLVDYVADEQLTSEKFLPRLLRERGCDGMLLNYSAGVPPMLGELAERFQLPTVWLNSRNDFNSVHPDDFGAARLATETLLAGGHRRVAYLDAMFNATLASGDLHFSKPARRAGYEAAMRAARRAPELLLDLVTPGLGRRDAVAASVAGLRAVFNRRRPAPSTAVIAYGAWDIGVLRQIPDGPGRAVEIMSFGHNDNALNDQCVRGLVVPLGEIGARAVAMLLRRIANPAPVPSEVVPFRWADAAS